MVPYGYTYGEPPPYGGGMPPPFPPPGGYGPPPGGPGGYGPPSGGPGYGPPPGMMMMPPPPGLGDPVGFLLPSLFKAIGGLFGGRRPAPPPPPPGGVTMMPGMPPLPQIFYQDRPQFCRMYCAPVPGAPGAAGAHRRRRRRASARLGEPVGALPLIAALAPLAASVLPGLIQGLMGGGRSNLSGYYGPPPPPPGYAGW